MKIKIIILSLLLSMTVANAQRTEKNEKEIKKSTQGLGTLVPSLEDVFADIYGGVSAFDISANEKEKMKQSGNAPTYGELTPKGITIIVNYMIEKLKGFFGEQSMPENLAFIDIGSGAGKVPLGACIEGPFSKCMGVEYSKERHDVAAMAQQKIKSQWGTLLPKGRELIFINDDALKVNLRGIHAIYVSSLCFEKPFMVKLLAKLEDELPDGAIVVTSQAFPTTPNSRLKLIRMFTVPQTWKADSKARAYQVGVKNVQVINDIPANWSETKTVTPS